MEVIMAVITGIRNIRGEMNIAPSRALAVMVQTSDEKMTLLLNQNREFIVDLARLEAFSLKPMGEKPRGTATVIVEDAVIFVYLEGIVDFSQETARLEKEIAKIDAEIDKLDKKLNNPGFVNKAPEPVVAKVRDQHQEYTDKKIQLLANLEKIQTFQSDQNGQQS
jgi:valyl-tRNA synthetase